MDPRLSRSRESALAAATSLLAESGITQLTHQNLAACSGLSRATVYRHWPTVTDLVLDLLQSFRMPDFVSSGGTVLERVRLNTEIQGRHFADPRYMGVYLAVQNVAQDDRVHARLLEINRSRVESVAAAFEPEFDLRSDPSRVVNLLALMNGPLLQYAAFVRAEQPPEELIGAVVESVDRYLRQHCAAG